MLLITVNLNGAKALLANFLSGLFVKGILAFRNGPRNLSRNPPDCTVLDKLAFDNFILTDEFFSKAIQSFKTCLFVSNNWCEN